MHAPNTVSVDFFWRHHIQPPDTNTLLAPHSCLLPNLYPYPTPTNTPQSLGLLEPRNARLLLLARAQTRPPPAAAAPAYDQAQPRPGEPRHGPSRLRAVTGGAVAVTGEGAEVGGGAGWQGVDGVLPLPQEPPPQLPGGAEAHGGVPPQEQQRPQPAKPAPSMQACEGIFLEEQLLPALQQRLESHLKQWMQEQEESASGLRGGSSLLPLVGAGALSKQGTSLARGVLVKVCEQQQEGGMGVAEWERLRSVLLG